MKFDVKGTCWMKEIKKILGYVYEQLRCNHTYCRFAKSSIRKLLREGKNTDAFLEEIRKQYILNTIDTLYKNNSDPQLQKCIDYVKEKGPRMYCYEEAERKHYAPEDVFYDEKASLYYAFWCGKKMYFKRSIDSKEKVLGYLNTSFWEQSPNSPHCYLSNTFTVENNGVILDVGAAEGNFTLSIIERIKKAYLFECEPEWIEALKYTFADYRDKICIIPKYISNNNSQSEMTIDAFCSEYGIQKIDMVKMDIEGAEIKALKGARTAINKGIIKKCAVCVYHNVGDAEKIEKILSNYRKEYAEGYIMSAIWQLHELKYPYWVKGVLRAELR